MEQFVDQWWLIFLDSDTGMLVHACGFEEEPSDEDIQHLYHELSTDFEINWEYLLSLDVRMMKPSDTDEYREFEALMNKVIADGNRTIH